MGELLSACLEKARPTIAELGEAECREMLAHVVAGVMMGSALGIGGANAVPAAKVVEALRAQMEPPKPLDARAFERSPAPCPECGAQAPVVLVGSSWCTECSACRSTSVIGKVTT